MGTITKTAKAAAVRTESSLLTLTHLAQAIEAEANTLKASDAKAADFLIGTAILGLANRAAFQVQSLNERMDNAKRLASIIAEDMGVTKGAAEIQKQRDNYSWAMAQKPAYEAVYQLCSRTWENLKGTRMPDQHPGKSTVRASAEELQNWLAS